MFQHQPPPKLILWFELVMTSREYARQVMEIKPEWLLEGMSISCRFRHVRIAAVD